MIIEIKGYKYIDPDWSTMGGVAMLKIANNFTFDQVVKDFVLQPGDVIKQYTDEEVQIGQYYVTQMGSIEMPVSGEENKIKIRYFIGNISQGTEERLEGEIEEISKGLLELAAMVADMEGNLDKKYEATKSERETGTKLANDKVSSLEKDNTQMQETLNAHNDMLRNIQKLVNGFADRIATIENSLKEGKK